MNKKPSLTRAEIEALISQDRRLRQNPWAHLGPDGGFEAMLCPKSTETCKNPGGIEVWIEQLLHSKGKRRQSPGRRQYSDAQIEQVATEVQRRLWRERASYWPDAQHDDPMIVLDPQTVLNTLGYAVRREPLGTMYIDGSEVRVAGVIDKGNREVKLSESLEPEVLRFTAAHELGHAVFHQESGMHRDRPLDGATKAKSRAPEEREADRFAVNFLMPRKLINREFSLRFGCERFETTTENLFFLSPSKYSEISESRREITRLLAGKQVNSDHGRLVSLADRFGVSIEAMAIRLEELGIVSNGP